MLRKLLFSLCCPTQIARVPGLTIDGVSVSVCSVVLSGRKRLQRSRSNTHARQCVNQPLRCTATVVTSHVSRPSVPGMPFDIAVRASLRPIRRSHYTARDID
ncbi:unnamed protein product [Ixodes pacificus]